MNDEMRMNGAEDQGAVMDISLKAYCPPASPASCDQLKADLLRTEATATSRDRSDEVILNQSILSTIGHTPLVRLTRVLPDCPFRLFAKLEGFNPGGSAKDRPALHILQEAMGTGALKPWTVVIESSSGNLGIGLAQACRYLGLRFICVVDPNTTPQNIRIMRAYGAEIDLVSKPHPVTGGFLQARIDRVQTLLQTIEDSFWTNQYANLSNARAHYRTTMHEIATELGAKIDCLFVATSTCGTLRGCAEYVRDHHLDTHIFAVDAHGSVIFGGEPGKRLIPGHGAARRPELYRADLANKCLKVTDLDCIVGCRRLVQSEAILAGGSSGGVLMAIEQVKERIPRGGTCVAIFHDRGERYLDTIYCDEWVAEHFGNIAHLWQNKPELQACMMAA
jgi:cysteine synthase A